MPRTSERRRQTPPLRFDWRRTYIWEPEPHIVYVCQPHESVALQAWRTGSASWSWIALDVRTRVVLRHGATGTMIRAKLAAEAAIDNLDAPQQTIWTEIKPDDDPAVPF